MKIARVINFDAFERDAIYKFCRLANMLYMHIALVSFEENAISFNYAYQNKHVEE